MLYKPTPVSPGRGRTDAPVTMFSSSVKQSSSKFWRWTLSSLILLQFSCDKTDPSDRTAGSDPRSSATMPAEGTATRPATSPSAAEAQASEDKLYGTWVADDVDAKIGQVKIKLTFRKDGPMKLAAWSDIPFVGQVRDKTGPFKVEGNVISSDAIRGGTSVEFWFEEDQLVIRYKEGKTVSFRRM